MNILESTRERIASLGNYKTADIDKIIKEYIKKDIDVSCFKEYVLKEQYLHRIYFAVSLAQIEKIEERYKFIEDNFDNLNDWWHVDQLTMYLKEDNFDRAYSYAKIYVNDSRSFVRRWGYVLFLPKLIKETRKYPRIVDLFHDDDEYYVQMGIAWIISYMFIYDSNFTYNFLKDCKMKYDILGKAIQKTCDSFRVDDKIKEKIKELRPLLKNN